MIIEKIIREYFAECDSCKERYSDSYCSIAELKRNIVNQEWDILKIGGQIIVECDKCKQKRKGG